VFSEYIDNIPVTLYVEEFVDSSTGRCCTSGDWLWALTVTTKT